MAYKKLYAGMTGPNGYEDGDLVSDRDGDFVGVTRHASITDGQHWIGEVPTLDEHAVRKVDFEQWMQGMIVLWDTASAIPPNWEHCNGTSASPDLTAFEMSGIVYIKHS